MFNPKWIVGKKVASVEMNAFDDGRGGQAFAPRICFDDGSSITFSTVETEGDYATSINYTKGGA